jgi:hypothetical protein
MTLGRESIIGRLVTEAGLVQDESVQMATREIRQGNRYLIKNQYKKYPEISDGKE